MLLQRIDDARLKKGCTLSRRQVAQGMVDHWCDDAEAVARVLVGLPAVPRRAISDDVPELAKELLEAGHIQS